MTRSVTVLTSNITLYGYANDAGNGAAGFPSSSGARRFDGSAPTTGIMPHEHHVT
ncbi:hypothetical protein ACGFZJ_34575 [Streptomyces sp. NPDC048253]|uniref:hypothetical protein n=1 Tax=Streptomyces sp. NPDC048253 TaxID=3365524 RepID=UPI00371B6CE1